MLVHNGVGTNGGGTTTTLGGIGTGYLYADWKGQIAYTTPNMNGLLTYCGYYSTMECTRALSTASATSSGLLIIWFPRSRFILMDW